MTSLYIIVKYVTIVLYFTINDYKNDKIIIRESKKSEYFSSRPKRREVEITAIIVRGRMTRTIYAYSELKFSQSSNDKTS